MIHVCYTLRDESGKYSKFIGTSILSLLENTHESVTIHLIHDSTLTEGNRKKFLKLVYSYNQDIIFYNVDELCQHSINEIQTVYPQINVYYAGISCLYRFFITELIPPEVKKIIYLDADTVVNLDINELYSTDLQTYPFAAVTESASGLPYDHAKNTIELCKTGLIKPENYFNAGVWLMNLDNLRGGGESIIG